MHVHTHAHESISGVRLDLRSDDLDADIRTMLGSAFPHHPFESPVDVRQLPSLLANYLAMSIAFPHIQAGAQHEQIRRHIVEGSDLSIADEVTLAAGAYLTADETGLNQVVLSGGVTALDRAFDTRRRFHSALLRRDVALVLGHDIKPSFSRATQQYLLLLEARLGSADVVDRVATMVSFEVHAERMIAALWDRIHETGSVQKDELTYFASHVGADEPLEAHHVMMTTGMILQTITCDDVERFSAALLDGYELHLDWCAALCAPSAA